MPSRLHLGVRAVIHALTWVALGCSRLPEAAAPKLTTTAEHPSVPGADVTGYRQLTRADFKGKLPPPEFAAIADRVGAATCTQVSTSPGTRVTVTERLEDGTRQFSAQVVELSFFAVMDRACSWWNDERAAFSPGYVLEHEQIHFALTEIVARRMNAEAADSLARLRFTAPTPRAALELAESAILDRLRDASELMLEENRAFDEETSMGHEPERQRRWRARVERELHETGAWGLR